jgi:hypothetical protein
MSSRDLSRVVALSCKAYSLQEKHHFVRASEKFAAATAAAQELSQVDCLVVTHMRLMHVVTLHGYAQTPGLSAEAASAATKQAFEMLFGAIATLERRREAGTLLFGTCRSWPEEEWYGQFLQHRLQLFGERAYTPKELALLVKFVGYDAYIYVAASAVLGMNPFERRPASEIQALGRFALSAFELLELPRHEFMDHMLDSETALTTVMQSTCEICSPLIERRDPRISAPVVELYARWQRFARSDVSEELDIGAGASRFLSGASARDAVIRAELAAATLRCCSLRSCAARELHQGHYKRCGACHGVVYCCREHQLEDWPAHKAACKAARKAAAAAEGGGAA